MYYWNGIYQNFKEVPRTDNIDYVSCQVFELGETLNQISNHQYLPSLEQQLFVQLVKSIEPVNSDHVKILDFGGGLGLDYVVTRYLDSIPMDYTIIEQKLTCKVGNELFITDNNIKFIDAFPEITEVFDIVYLNSSLQYVEDFRAALDKLASYKSNFFVFVRLSAGDIPTYATSQVNMPDLSIPYWFTNFNEIKTIISSYGYSLVHKSQPDRVYNQDNFPYSYRMGRAINAFFKRD